MRFKIESAPVFVQEASIDPKKPGRNALSLAALWLSKQSERGWEPLQVVALGHEARCQLFGDAHGRGPIVFRQVAVAAPSPSASTPAPTAKKRATK